MKSIGHEGLNNLLAAYEDKSAKAVCTFGFSKGPGHEPILFQGIADVMFSVLTPRCVLTTSQGKIVPARGPAYFGWDPVFEYKGQTFAEMDQVEKSKISHRYKALEKLRVWVENGMKD